MLDCLIFVSTLQLSASVSVCLGERETDVIVHRGKQCWSGADFGTWEFAARTLADEVSRACGKPLTVVSAPKRAFRYSSPLTGKDGVKMAITDQFGTVLAQIIDQICESLRIIT